MVRIRRATQLSAQGAHPDGTRERRDRRRADECLWPGPAHALRCLYRRGPARHDCAEKLDPLSFAQLHADLGLGAGERRLGIGHPALLPADGYMLDGAPKIHALEPHFGYGSTLTHCRSGFAKLDFLRRTYYCLLLFFSFGSMTLGEIFDNQEPA